MPIFKIFQIRFQQKYSWSLDLDLLVNSVNILKKISQELNSLMISNSKHTYFGYNCVQTVCLTLKHEN